jgi:alpha-glucosidase
MSATTIYSSGPIEKFSSIQSGIQGNTGNANFKIQFFSDQIVNIRFTRESAFESLSYAVVQQPEVVKADVSEKINQLVMSGKYLDVILSKNDSSIQFLNKSGKVINADEQGLGTQWNGEQVATYKKLQPEEKFIGLGEKTGPLNRRGHGYQHWNIDAFAYGTGTDPIYSSIPFYIGVHGGLVYGIFFDNPAKTFFNFGASNNRFSSFYADNGEMNYYFIYGETVAEVIRAYTWLTGTIQLPPLWSLGFQQCRYSYYPDTEVINLAKNFREKKIPADTIVLDIHHMDAYKIFTWHPENFPEPKKLIGRLKELGFHVVVICDPGIKTETGYPPYDEGLEKDLFLKYPDGQPYTGQVWPGWCHFPDFTKPETRSNWRKWMKQYADAGVTGFWNDMNEFSSWGQMMPENILFDFDGTQATSRQGRNVYGLQMARSSYEGGVDHLGGRRPFILTRSGYAGIQRYAALWTGDNVSYDEHMMLGVRLVNSLGLSGVAFAGYDIGGFVGEASSKLFARWISIGAFSPFFRVHSMINTRSSEPWSYGEEVEIISRNYIRFRYQLLPYLYSIFREASVTGMPVQRSLAIDYTHQEEVYSGTFEHQYLFGPSFLVAPAESSKDIIKVFFPEGTWYSLNDGTVYPGNTVATVDAPIHRLPVFVKAGSVIPFQDPVQYTGEKSETIHLHVYNGKNNSTFEWYLDDGQTFKFQQGVYAIRKLTFDGSSRHITIGATIGQFKPDFKTIRIVFHGFKKLEKLFVNEKSVNCTTQEFSFFLPMQKFDPLGDAPSVGSEQVHFIEMSYTDEEVLISI